MKQVGLIFVLFLLYALVVFRPEPIPINTDDFLVLNIMRDMVEAPSYFALSGGGHRIVHRLVYLPFFWFYDFDVNELSFVTMLVTVFFSLLFLFFTYVFFSNIFNSRVALLTVFFLMVSHAIVRVNWYWSSTHIIIGLLFFTIAILFLTKQASFANYIFFSFFSMLSMFTRETFVVMVFPIAVFSLFLEQRYLRLRNYCVAFFPFLLYAVYVFLNKYFIGTIIHPNVAGMVQPSFSNLSNLFVYFDYLLATMIVLPVGLAVLLFLLNRKNYVIAKLSSAHIIILLWFLSGVLVLLISSNTDHRYIISVLPVIFALTAKIIDDVVFSLNEHLFVVAEKIMFFQLVFWVLVFSSKLVQDYAGISYALWGVLLNLLLYCLILFGLFYPWHISRSFSRHSLLCSLFLLFLSVTSFVQLGMVYYFYVWHYDNSVVINETLTYLAKVAPADSVVVTNPANPVTMTGISSEWLRAFRRPDIVVSGDVSLNFTSPVFYLGTPTSFVDNDVITPFARANKDKLKLVAQFGSKLQRHPVIKIPSTFSRFVDKFISTGMLFTLEQNRGYVVLVFRNGDG
ncbi:hypothetical protein HY485_01845 [Candidatus Woesearchaeota archaeon]|nr:hypothetical protein [Candidatus Woesearchaeota archaeon]